MFSPIQEVGARFVSGAFNGDDITRPHDILWNMENYLKGKGGRPSTFEKAEIAVVGGGMSGLLSAYLLRDRKPVLFEQATQFGGNSQGESFRGTSYSIGAAYVGVPDAGGETERLFRELGIQSEMRVEPAGDAKVSFVKEGLKGIWEGETDPARRASFEEVNLELAQVYSEGYPEIPWKAGGDLSWEEYAGLDRQTAREWLRTKFPRLHPHVEEYFQLYCWSSLGGSLDELSAAHFLNFVAAETQGVAAFPGGNARIAQALHQKLEAALPPENIQCGAMVLEVKNVAEGVEILFEDRAGKIRLLRAKSAIVAAPKYVARWIVKDLPAARAEAWKALPYRAYVVVNVLLKAKVPSPAFDIFRLEGKAPATPTFGNRTDRPFADFVFGGWAAGDQGGASVLTLYKPYPFEGARSLITSEIGHQRIEEEIEKNLPEVLAGVGMGRDSIEGMRITRWGHALPLAQPGMVSGPALELFSAPHGNIYFANQDNFVCPAFESCFEAARAAVRKLQD